MIDTWLLASACLVLLLLGAIFRIVRTKSRNDRFLAALVAITIGSAAGLTLSISQGTLLFLDIAIALSLLCFAFLIAAVRFTGGAGA